MLNQRDANTIYKAALNAGLSDPKARRATLMWLPKDVAAMLPVHHEPALQLRSDIMKLVEWQGSGLKVLDLWLDGAIGVAESIGPVPQALRDMLERVLEMSDAQGEVDESQSSRVRITFVGACPRGTPRLSITRELEEIRRVILRAPRHTRFELSETYLAARPDELREIVERSSGNVLHVSAHGMRDGSLMLEGPTGGQEEFSKDAFVDMVRLINTERGAEERIRMVVLNDCTSNLLAEALVSTPDTKVDVAIGTSEPIDDEAAIKFAQSFYSAIASSKSVGYAAEAGRQAVKHGGPGISANASFFHDHAPTGSDTRKIWLIPT